MGAVSDLLKGTETGHGTGAVNNMTPRSSSMTCPLGKYGPLSSKARPEGYIYPAFDEPGDDS